MTLLSARYEISFCAEWITDPVIIAIAFEDKDKDGELIQTTDPATNEVPHRYHYYSRRDLGASTEEPLARPNPAGWGDSFGMQWDLGHTTVYIPPDYSEDNRYEYNGKEYERVAQLLDYGWRWYDPVIGRWGGVDAMADHPNQINMSPFAYAWNNPILLIDPDGLCPKCPPSPDPSSSGTTIRHAYSQSFRLMAHPYQQMIKSGYNRLANFFSPGEAQQHSGDNVVVYGKGSPSGYEVPGSHANPEGNTHAIEGLFDAMIGRGPSNSLGKGVLNPIMHVDGFNNTVNTLGEQFNSKNNRNVTKPEVPTGVGVEIPPGNRVEVTPGYGQSDTIVNPDGSRSVRQRSAETGILLNNRID